MQTSHVNMFVSFEISLCSSTHLRGDKESGKFKHTESSCLRVVITLLVQVLNERSMENRYITRALRAW